jgi:hypothetical protein
MRVGTIAYDIAQAPDFLNFPFFPDVVKHRG